MEETTDTVEDVQAPIFDPSKVDIHDKHINTTFRRDIVDGEAINTVNVNWVPDYSQRMDSEENKRPDWADLPMQERVYMTLPDKLVNVITRQVLTLPNQFVHELPCPPYQFDMDDGKLRIKAGAFQKSGSKAEWKQVIEQMQAEVEDMPDGIDTTDLPEVTLNISVTASTSHDISVDELLSGHDLYDGEIFAGDKGDLEQALEEAIENMDSYDIEVDLSYVDDTEVEVTGDDLDYVMRQVDEG